MKFKTVIQIIFCLLSVASVIVAMILGFLKGLGYFLIFVLCALVFALLMLLTKNFTSKKQKGEETDFLNSPEENERIIEEQKEKDSFPKE